MTDDELLQSLSPRDAVALTLYGEARGERVEGRIAVGCVIRNRVDAQRFGGHFKGVCLAPKQFSCWNADGSQNYGMLILAARALRQSQMSASVKECVWIAEGVINGAIRDTTRGATHYITRALWESAPPKWAIGQTPCALIDRHVFFAGIA